MEVAFLAGRIILGVYYLFNAFNHFTRLEMLSAYAASKRVPAPKLLTIVTGVLLLVGGLSILLGVYPVVGVVALAAFFIPVTFWMHDFWAVQDPMQKAIQMVNFTKNLALLGAALMLLAFPQPWPLGLGK
ncbi:MAG: DoxX family protein [Armatimonadota bacterium]|nr:DoxX family protein [Armatimonadota bacterium]MDR7427710.1 DoxX family protein [Armatimonadota bacterium]MDR7469621.1 DoxX family protein [Armatimonadota bacterium]MDR7474948.1 DoxX family protein [Armatimonadota bacterium]MDR7538340.1 DoxX family protein [Armatimonadota bacterium]